MKRWRRDCLIAVFAVLLISTPVAGQNPPTPERYADWSTPPFASGEYSLRRQRLLSEIQQAGGGLLLIPSATGITNGETFRQADDFFYFTGLEFPRSILVFDADRSRAVLFAPRNDFRFDNPDRPNDFPGRPLGDDPSISAEAGMLDIRPFELLAEYLEQALQRGAVLRINLGSTVSDVPVDPFLSWTPELNLLRYLRVTIPEISVADAQLEIASVRMFKSDAELEKLRLAAALTANGIMAAAAFVRQNMDERGLEAEFEASCKRGGSQRLSFSSIIKSGPNSLWPWRILAAHYDRRNRVLQDGDLVIFDVGCELDSYVSDVGRTFPVSGSFTERQKEILEMVTAVSDSIIANIQPGATFTELMEVARRNIPEEHQRYMQAGMFFGHHLGLSAGDPSLPERPLEPGMVFTVEPWYYNHDENIAVFIEDVVAVTSTGAEVFTERLPRRPEDLERMVRLR